MGVPTWEVGYTSAMPRREDHEVLQGHVGHWIKKKKKIPSRIEFSFVKFVPKYLNSSTISIFGTIVGFLVTELSGALIYVVSDSRLKL